MKPKNHSGEVDEYISGFTPEIQEKLKQIRKVIKKAVPLATEKISYGMPSFYLEGMLLYYAAHKNHIGFYPTTSAMEVFRNELSDYSCSKGTIQFPYSKKLPLKLIERISVFRANENMEKILRKSKR